MRISAKVSLEAIVALGSAVRAKALDVIRSVEGVAGSPADMVLRPIPVAVKRPVRAGDQITRR